MSGAASQFTWTDKDTCRGQSAPFTVVEVDPPRTFSFRWIYDEGEAVGGRHRDALPGREKFFCQPEDHGSLANTANS